MGAPTSVSVSITETEYSRYQLDKKEIVATVQISGGAPYTNEQVTVELTKARRNRDAVVSTQTLTFNGASSPQTGTITFKLDDVVDQDLINLVRHGRYFLKAYSVTNTAVKGESGDFDIRIVTIDTLKKDFLFGIDLKATEVRHVKFQPVAITGITVSEISAGHAFGFFSLTYSYHVDGASTIRTLSWSGGPATPIAASGTYLLRSGGSVSSRLLTQPLSNDYVVVKVTLGLLPTANVEESLLVEKKAMDDASLGRYLDEAVNWLENSALQVHVEPTNVVTDVDPTTVQYAAGIGGSLPLIADNDFDFLVSPLTYFLPQSSAWVTIQTQFPQVIRVDNLFGAIASTRVIDIDLDWIEVSQQGGLLQLVPFNQEIAFDFIGLMWSNAIRGASELPNFWHFNMIVGLQDCHAELREVIGKKAAIDALVQAGMALRPGVGSLSLSRDGVSESVSYTTGAQYGIYTATITAFKEWLTERMPSLRAKYRGAIMRVV